MKHNLINRLNGIMQTICQGLKPVAQQRIGIIGVPFDKGQKKYGVGIAPAAMRAAGLIGELKQIAPIDIKDYGDIDTTMYMDENVKVKNMRNLAMVSACSKNLSEKVTEVLKDNRIVITIGGDHSIAIGTVDGHLRVHENLILIWVDAHADINTDRTSYSGSIHGMAIAVFMQEFAHYWVSLPTMDWLKRKFSVKSLGYIGLRSVDPYEKLAIEKFHILHYAMGHIKNVGIENATYELLKRLDPGSCRPIHVSFDIDSLDVLEAPSTGTPVHGGLTLREGIKIMEIIHATGRLRAMDLVEINPYIGNDNDRQRTIEAGMSVLKAALGFVEDFPIPDKTS